MGNVLIARKCDDVGVLFGKECGSLQSSFDSSEVPISPTLVFSVLAQLYGWRAIETVLLCSPTH